MKTRLILLLAAILICIAASGQSVMLKQTISQELHEYGIDVVPSAKTDDLADRLFKAWLSGDKRKVNAIMDNEDWFFGIDVLGGDSQYKITDQIRNKTDFSFQDPSVDKTSVAVASDGTGYLVLIISY